ncbi:MAG: phosphatase PAP2 family protein [Pseudomonadota bacterium]
MRDRDALRKAKADAGPIELLDLAAVEATTPYEDHPAVKVIGSLSELADQPPLIGACLATAAVGLVRRDARLTGTGLRMLAAHAVATGAKTLIKNAVDRSRPGKAADQGEHRFEPGQSEDGADRSFPSGHTAGAMAVARAVSRGYPAAAGPATLTVLAVASIQVPRKARYPSDLLAGAVIGLGAEYLVDQISRTLRSA